MHHTFIHTSVYCEYNIGKGQNIVLNAAPNGPDLLYIILYGIILYYIYTYIYIYTHTYSIYLNNSQYVLLVLMFR